MNKRWWGSKAFLMLLGATTFLALPVSRIAAGGAPDKWVCTPVKTPACDCADVNDLINRWNIDNAAIAQYRHQIAGLKARAAVSGAPIMFSYPLYVNVVEANANALMKAMFSPGQTSAKGGTDGGCNTTIDSPTFCLCVVLKAHEDTHVDDCEQHKTNEPGPDYSDYRNSRTMVQVITDEIFGYKKAIDKINDILRSMPAKCKPKQWTGVVNYSDTVVTSSTTSIPPDKGAKVEGGTSSTNYNKTFTATVSAMNGEAYANVDATEISKGSQEITSMVKCHVNEPLRADTHHDNSVVTNEAHGYGKAPSFQVNLGNDRYTISFQTPQTTVTRNQTRDLSPAACGPPFVPQPVNGPFTVGQGNFHVSGKGKPTDLALSGSETNTQQLTGGTRTVTISWNLFRSDSSGAPVADVSIPQDQFRLSGPFELQHDSGQDNGLEAMSRAPSPCTQ